MKASIIIPTRDRADALDACLRSLTKQSIPAVDFEVIVVDNGSVDETPHVVARHQPILQLRYEYAPEPGLHVGRHAGLRLARSDVLVFADDDIVADPSWLTTITQAFSDTTVALVGGNNLPLFEQPPPSWLTRWWNTSVGRGRALAHLSILDFGEGRFPIDPHFVWGCNFSIRRQALIAAGGFHPDAMPAERLRWRGDGETHVSEWVRRSGMQAIFDSGASVQHRVPASRMTLDYFVRRAYAQGISDSYADIRRTGRASGLGPTQALRHARAAVQRLRLRSSRAADAADVDLRKVKLDTLDAWRKGYNFHRREVCADPALFAWVTKEAYL